MLSHSTEPTIQYFSIIGLFGKYDVRLPLRKKPLVLVGPNGTGKSTVLSILNLTLTGQWTELLSYPFERISMEFSDHSITLDKDDVILLRTMRRVLSSSPFPRRRVASPAPVSWDEAQRLFRMSRAAASPDLVRTLEHNYDRMQQVYNFVEKMSRPSVMYYPTYRRIERDIGDIIDLGAYEELEVNLNASISKRFEELGEVIGFGGQDIQGLIDSAASDIENNARAALNEHSVRFLELIYQTGKLSTKQYRDNLLNDRKISRLVERIETLAPGTIDTNALRHSVASIQEKIRRGGAGRLSSREDIAIFYISQLLGVFNRIEHLTTPLKMFCDTVTSYLSPYKKAVFDEGHFGISLENMDGDEVDLDDFSSGEKQIVSLFAFLMFSNAPRGNFLLLDEPELSLSVVWQERLLEDILRTHRPQILVTATHSPFIFANLSLDHIVAMDELLAKADS